MCGIFGFILKKPVSMNKVFRILTNLESSQYPGEGQPVGGFGAGIAVMLSDGNIISEKVGKNIGSPACELAEIMKPKLKEAQVLIGHVRYPSQDLMGTVKYKEAAQPYVEHFESKLTVVSAHNGNIENYKELKAKIKDHIFESEKIGFVDSEIIPHYFGEMLNEMDGTDTAVYELLSSIKGSSAIALLQVDDEDAWLHLVHKGSARGLIIWTNEKNEVIFCSRPEPVEEELKALLAIGNFKEKVRINWKEDAGLKLSFPAILQ
jgi:glucosamine 6-phosphate synthetase-like amidotransferase/phosphosugar isomerase protein